MESHVLRQRMIGRTSGMRVLVKGRAMEFTGHDRSQGPADQQQDHDMVKFPIHDTSQETPTLVMGLHAYPV
jgi:hypothetical protein